MQESVLTGTWQPMGVPEKGCVGGARVKFCDVAALMR